MRIVAPDGKSWCRGHGAFLDVSEFGLKYPERGILQGLCRACQRKASRMYYLRDPEPYKARAKAGRRRARERNRERVREFLRANKCADCGIIEFAVLEFDHRDPRDKRALISGLLTVSWAAVSREIAKCDVVCANCHRKRTAKQFGWRKLLGFKELVLPSLPKRGTPDYERIKSIRSRLARRYRNYKYVYEYLREHACVLCGESDPVCLDFDHLRDKFCEVTLIAVLGGMIDLLAEIEKCRVLCANCHRRQTAHPRVAASQNTAGCQIHRRSFGAPYSLATNLQHAWSMAVMSYMYTFRVRPEQQAEFVAWARTAGIPFWMSQPGLLSYRTYRIQAGSGTSMGVAEFESGEALGRMLDSAEWMKITDEFQQYVSETQSWVLGPGATGEEPLRPASAAAATGRRA